MLCYRLPQEYDIHRSLFKYVKVKAVGCTFKQYGRKTKKLKSSLSSASYSQGLSFHFSEPEVAALCYLPGFE